MLADALAEGAVHDLCQALEKRIVLELCLRIDAQQVGRGHHAFEGGEVAILDLLLQGAARCAHKPGST